MTEPGTSSISKCCASPIGQMLRTLFVKGVSLLLYEIVYAVRMLVPGFVSKRKACSEPKKRILGLTCH